ncbi:MAG: TonB family protein [Bacteroidales bacterium]|nr:TonB family protein [Bacteroidales bacterium]
MKKVLLIATMLVVAGNLLSQEYYTAKWEKCQPKQAMYALFSPESDSSNLHLVKVMAKGKFTGSEGYFATNDKKNGNLIMFAKGMNRILYNATIINGLRQGPSRVFRADGTVIGIQQFAEGKQHGVSEYYFKSGKRSAAIEYKDGKKIKEEYWDEDGTVVTDKSGVTQKPLFRGKPVESEFVFWVSRNLTYPESCRDARIEGEVQLRFTITEEGRLTDIEVISSPHPDLSAEAVSVVSNSPLWNPARMYNQTVSVVYNFPIIFKLQEAYRRAY